MKRIKTAIKAISLTKTLFNSIFPKRQSNSLAELAEYKLQQKREKQRKRF